jgi:hypothetical protein
MDCSRICPVVISHDRLESFIRDELVIEHDHRRGLVVVFDNPEQAELIRGMGIDNLCVIGHTTRSPYVSVRNGVSVLCCNSLTCKWRLIKGLNFDVVFLVGNVREPQNQKLLENVIVHKVVMFASTKCFEVVTFDPDGLDE